MPDPIKAMEMMNQLSLDYGKEPPAKARSTANDKASNPELAEKFKQNVDDAITEREAQKNLRKIESNKAKAEIADMAEKHRAEKTSANEYKKYPASIRPAGGGSSGTGGAAELKSITNPRAMKSGGKVKSASTRADGCCIRGKTRA
jgi:hypothetical protein